MKQYLHVFFVVGLLLLVPVIMINCGKIECGDINNNQSDDDIEFYGCKGTKKYNRAKRDCTSLQLMFYAADPQQNIINLMCATGCPEVGMCM